MRTAWIAGGLLGLMLIQPPLCAAKPASIEARAQSPLEAARQALRVAFGHLRNKDMAAADRSFEDVVAAAGFTDLSVEEQYDALSFAGRIAGERGEPARAHPLLVRASAYAQAEGGIWHARLAAAEALDDDVDAARCIATIARRWPQTLAELDARAITRLAARLADQPAFAADRLDLLEGLFGAGFTVDGVQPSILWRALAGLLLERGQVGRATAVAQRIEAARDVVILRTDRRFDRIARNAPRFDVVRAIDAELERARKRVEAEPGRLEPRTALQVHLLEAAYFDEALAISDEVIARVTAGDGATFYPDFRHEYPWILDHRSRALYGLGRWDEAIDAQRRAARRPEYGDMNVSQALNLAWLYAELGRPDEALEAVSEMGPPSPYGRMQLEMLRLMVAVQRKDAVAIEKHLAFMRAHRADAIQTYQLALAHVDRADDGAALLIERLRSPHWREEALGQMQDYIDVPAPPTKQARNERWRALIERPDVQAALAAVGRIEPVPLVSPGF